MNFSLEYVGLVYIWLGMFSYLAGMGCYPYTRISQYIFIQNPGYPKTQVCQYQSHLHFSKIHNKYNTLQKARWKNNISNRIFYSFKQVQNFSINQLLNHGQYIQWVLLLHCRVDSHSVSDFSPSNQTPMLIHSTAQRNFLSYIGAYCNN